MGTMISYAINREDVVLNRVFGGKAGGFFIDVGANHPVTGSTTKHFSDLGWTGINVEPLPDLASLLRQQRPNDIVLEVAVSDVPGQATLYQLSGVFAALSTFSRVRAEQYRSEGLSVTECAVPVRTLADICRENVGNQEIDFLSVDVEGAERAVLLGMDFARWRPRVVVVEATLPRTNIPTHSEWEKILLSAGYEFGLFDGINRFYVRREDSELLPRISMPANCLDPYQTSDDAHLVRELERCQRRCEGLGKLALLAARGVQGVVNQGRRVWQALTGRESW
jgi:FkbM family methyltransferase